MKPGLYVVLAIGLALFSGCTGPQNEWRVEQIAIEVIHASHKHSKNGFVIDIEYSAARLSQGQEVLHLVYRPIDFPGRNPGFSEGETVTLSGVDKAKDFGAVDGPDYWIGDITLK